MLQHRRGLEPQMVGRWDRKREKLFRKKYSQRLVKVADREKKKSRFYYKKKPSSTNLLENTMLVTILGKTKNLMEHQWG